MKTRVGLWIDHRKAVVVALTEKGGEMGLILSRVERQLRRTGDSPLRGRCEPESVPAEDVRQRVFTGHLNMYYGAVAASLTPLAGALRATVAIAAAIVAALAAFSSTRARLAGLSST